MLKWLWVGLLGVALLVPAVMVLGVGLDRNIGIGPPMCGRRFRDWLQYPLVKRGVTWV